MRAWIRYLALLVLVTAPVATASALERVKNYLGMEFVRVPAGTFFMGSPESEVDREDNEVLHRVTLTQDYWLQTTEVTRAHWVELMQGDPSSWEECGPQCPVARLEWEWVEAFLHKLGLRDPDFDYRLPTEAEWEYAARAGTSTAFHTGKCLLQKDANIKALDPYSDCAIGVRSQSPKPVASYAPNAWGLHDMHGNVWELCSDWYGDYPVGPVTDPHGPEKGEVKVLRGGSFFNGASFARSAKRFPAIRPITGIRLVAVPKLRSAEAAKGSFQGR